MKTEAVKGFKDYTGEEAKKKEKKPRKEQSSKKS